MASVVLHICVLTGNTAQGSLEESRENLQYSQPLSVLATGAQGMLQHFPDLLSKIALMVNISILAMLGNRSTGGKHVVTISLSNATVMQCI